MRKLTPSHIVFNGKVGALTGANALTAKVGETVLLIHSQANRDTRPHLIGGHGDWVWETGKFGNPPQKNLETWFIRGGSAGAALYTFKQPGVYAYLNHNLIEAFELGAAGHIKVEGKWNDDLMKQIKAPGRSRAEPRPPRNRPSRTDAMTQAARLVLLAVLAALPVASAGRTPLHRPSTPPVKNSTSPPVWCATRPARPMRPSWATARSGRPTPPGADALLATVLTGRAPCRRAAAPRRTRRPCARPWVHAKLGALIPHRRGRGRRPFRRGLNRVAGLRPPP